MVPTSRLALVASLLAYAGAVVGLALGMPNYDDMSRQAKEILARSTPVAPRFVVYSDQWTSASGPPDPAAINGFNVFALCFLLLDGAWDQAETWVSLSTDQRASIKSEYAAAGISLVVTAFGSTDVPTSSDADPVATADQFAAWVREYDLDGIDVDYEDFDAFDAGTAEAWLIAFTKQLRSQLPKGKYIITHAPVAPWFSPSLWSGGGYLYVDQTVGHLIDWYNVQFYNQGASEYTTCLGLLQASSSTWPKSALFQIVANGVPPSKIVVGKPATAASANNGYMDPNTLATCLQQAKNHGWNGGAMVWQFPEAASSWINTVRSLSWPST